MIKADEGDCKVTEMSASRKAMASENSSSMLSLLYGTVLKEGGSTTEVLHVCAGVQV